MPKQEISQPNPPPEPSQLPEQVLDLRISLNTQGALTPDEADAIRKFRRAADYLAACQ
jgi:xylulose-5-phosphate/fructose-6-phosphate phosphoketolase